MEGVKKEKKQSKQLLSFGMDGDEDEEGGGPAFHIKKKKPKSDEVDQARKRARAKAKARDQKADISAAAIPQTKGLTHYGMSSVGQYTPDKMNALKTNAVYLKSSSSSSNAPSNDPLPPMDDDISDDEPKGEYKPSSTLPSFGIIPEDKVEEVRRQRNTARITGSRPNPSLTSAGKSSSSTTSNTTSTTSSSSAKSQSTAVISASSASSSSSSSSSSSLLSSYGISEATSKGGLVEDEGEDEAPDYLNTGNRIKFGDPGKDKRPKSKNKPDIKPKSEKVDPKNKVRNEGDVLTGEEAAMAYGDNDNNVDDDDDEELRAWEEEQIRKGGGNKNVVIGGRVVLKSKPNSNSNMSSNNTNQLLGITYPASYSLPSSTTAQQQTYAPTGMAVAGWVPSGGAAPFPPGSGGGGGGGGGAPRASMSNPASSQPATFESKLEMVEKRLQQLKHKHSLHEKELAKCNSEVEAVENKLPGLSKSLKLSNSNYVLFQEVRDVLVDILDMLGVKAPMVEGATHDLMELWKGRQKAKMELSNLHWEDMADAAFGNKMPPPPPKLKGGGGGGGEVDEFGRDLNYVATQGKQRRSAVRERRKKKRAMTDDGEEGWSTEDWEDDNEEEDENKGTTAAVGGASKPTKSHWDRQRDALLEDAREIFGEVREDFTTFDLLKSKLETWKHTHPKSYKDAYISVSLPAIVAPYVRKELLSWTPIAMAPGQKEQPTFEKMIWYRQLFNYGVSEDAGAAQPSEDDPDQHIVPKIIEKVVVPWVLGVVDYQWNPLSSKHQNTMLTLIQEIESHCEDNSSVVGELKKHIIMHLQSIVNTHSKFPQVPPSTSPTTQQLEFCSVRWWRAVKLFAHIAQWRKVLPEKQVITLCTSHIIDNVLPFLLFQLERQVDRMTRGKADEEQGRRVVLKMASRICRSFPQSWAGNKSQAHTLSLLYGSLNKYLSTVNSTKAASAHLSATTAALEALRQLAVPQTTTK